MRVARRLVGVVAAVVLHHSLVSSRLESVEVGPTGAAEDACTDGDPSCEAWAEEGECFTNPGWMLVNCRKSCGKCGRVRVATGVRKQARGTSPMSPIDSLMPGLGSLSLSPSAMMRSPGSNVSQQRNLNSMQIR